MNEDFEIWWAAAEQQWLHGSCEKGLALHIWQESRKSAVVTIPPPGEPYDYAPGSRIYSILEVVKSVEEAGVTVTWS